MARRKSNKITLKETEMFIKMKLKSDKTWMLAALDKIATFQTVEEILTESTNNHNNVGLQELMPKYLLVLQNNIERENF